MDEELFHLAAVSTTDFIGPARYEKILKSMGNIKTFVEADTGEQMRLLGLQDPKFVNPLRAMPKKTEKVLQVCEKKGIRLIKRQDPDYPVLLRDIPQAPYLLYAWGQFNHTIPGVAIVGTRSVTPEAEAINRYFSRELTEYHIAIISGLAKGHDAIAARSALDANGYTIAVLGTGIDVPFPSTNSRLFDEIRDRGLILSEYPPGAPGMKYHFPLRNRIISGLAQAVLVIQAPQRSGALITAKYAEEQGRELFVVPGNPLDERNSGTNDLIQKGAKVALRPEDIVRDILTQLPPKKPLMDVESIEGISPEEKKLLKCLEKETYIEDLQVLTGLDAGRLSSVLTQLELKSLVRQYPGRYYSRDLSV